MLKCSRCRHIFPAERTQRAPAPTAPATGEEASPEEERDLELAFDEPTWDGEQADLAGAASLEEEDFSLGSTEEPPPPRRSEAPRREPRLLSAAGELDFDEPAERRKTMDAPARKGSAARQFQFEEEDFEGGAAIDRRQRAAVPSRWDDEAEEPDDPRLDDEDEEEADGEEEGVRRGRAWVLPLVMFFSVVVAGYFLLARELISDRAFAEEFVARLPMVGTSLAADRLLFRKVALSGIEGAFVRVKQGKEVFVISGNALNTASRPLRNIRIEGTLLDGGDRALQQETITVGGMDARRLLEKLSAREVEMLGRVEPSKKFQLEPGEMTSFAIVFANPPTGAQNFTARVASAQR